MTVSSVTSSQQFIGNGSTKVFSFAFKFFKDTDLVVFTTTTDGLTKVLTLGIDYTVTGAGNDNGGSITTTKAVAANTLLTVSRVLALTQPTDLKNQGPYFAEIHEDEFDRLLMQIQQVSGHAFQALYAPLTDPSGLDLQLPPWDERANKVLAFNDRGEPIASNLTLEQLEHVNFDLAAQYVAEAQAAAEQAQICMQQSCQCASDSAASADRAASAAARALDAVDDLLPMYVTFTGTGAQKTFTLPQTITDEAFLDVYFNGTHQNPGTYSVSGSSLTFTTAPGNGVQIDVKMASGLQVMTLDNEDWGDLLATLDTADWGFIAA